LSSSVASRQAFWRIIGFAVLAASVAATAFMVVWWGAADIGAAVWRALPALPAALAVHGVQLTLSGLGWWLLLPTPRPSLLAPVRARWVREAVNTVLPLAGVTGAVAATRLLARDTGISMAAATASTTIDLTCEAASQAPYLAMALAAVALLAPGHLSPGRAALAILPITAGAVAFVIAQRAGMMRLFERAARALGAGAAMEGLHDGLMALHARRGSIASALTVHTTSWSLGGAEVWVIMNAIGHPVGPGAAFAIEGLGMAARSAGFALPAGLAAQEAGFVLAGALFGISAPDAVALSMVKRVRELVVGVAGAAFWQFTLWWPRWRR
jgi:putative membrane protein